MSISGLRLGRQIRLFGVLWILCAHEASPQTRAEDYMMRAKQLLLALYPGANSTVSV